MVAIARQGLKNRARLSGGMVDERGYLSELDDIADSGITPAERLLDLYHGDWQGDVAPGVSKTSPTDFPRGPCRCTRSRDAGQHRSMLPWV
jgi:hypothetical protein